jgi:hypothetical protein
MPAKICYYHLFDKIATVRLKADTPFISEQLPFF